MKRLSASQQVSVIRGLNRLREHALAAAVESGVLLLATETETHQLDCMQLRPEDRSQFAFSLTSKGRDALHTEGS